MAVRSGLRPAVFSLLLGVLATVLAVQALWLTYAAHDVVCLAPRAACGFSRAGVEGMSTRLSVAVGVLALAVLCASLLAVVRRGWVLRFTQSVAILGYIVSFFAIRCLTRAVNAYMDGVTAPGGFSDRDRLVQFALQANALKWVLPALVGFVLIHIFTSRRDTICLYTGDVRRESTTGDRLVEDLRSGGEDPEFRKCWLMSLGTHAVVLFLVPLLLQFTGCATRRYDPPPRSDDSPKPTPIKVIKRPRVQIPIQNPNSPILYVRPLDFRLSEVLAQLDAATQIPYISDPSRVMVQGRGRKESDGRGNGWPGWKGAGKVKFFRLAYSGDGWSDGMGADRAGANLLAELGRAFKGMSIDAREEAIPVKALSEFVKGHAPPVVFMTGDGLIRFSDREVKALREYLLNGGMLFADSGSGAFHQQFCELMGRVLPEDRFVALPDDDEIFNAWFSFPNGAPPIWPHGSDRAKGVRRGGRLCVFFHPGDLNDAWKTGHSGLTRDRAELAYQMGINVFYYGFKQYAQVAMKQK